MSEPTTSSKLAEIIRRRQTWKVLADPKSPIEYPAATIKACDSKVKQCLETSGWAPFHYDRGVDGIAEPWRAHVLDVKTCRQLAIGFPNLFDDVKPSNKLPGMLAACGSLVLVTWSPQFSLNAVANNDADVVSSSDDMSAEKKRQIDEEHLAATAAMTQNFLLLLTAEGLGSYWSSGGQLGSAKAFEMLGIKPGQRLSAAVFVEYPNGEGEVTDRIAGKNRDRRSSFTMWLSEPKLRS